MPIAPNAPRYIQLTQGKQTLVDASDYEWLNRYKWFAHKGGKGSKSGYIAERLIRPISRGPQVPEKMARKIMDVTDPNLEVDHKNHDTLDNRRKNLRIVTSAQNSQNRRRRSDNSSGYKGISNASIQEGVPRWRVRIQANGHGKHLGYFKTLEEAVAAYQAAAIEMHGEFACLE